MAKSSRFVEKNKKIKSPRCGATKEPTSKHQRASISKIVFPVNFMFSV